MLLINMRNRNPITKTHENSTRVNGPANTIPVVRARPTHSMTNGGASLNSIGSNPIGREEAEGKNKGNTLLSCKTYVQVATFNTRTIRTEDKRLELANNFNKCKLDILGIVDHKIVHEDDPVLIQQLDNCMLITTSAWRNSNGAASGGVGVVVSNKAEKALAEVKPVNDRILVVIFSGNPSTTLIINYAPTEGSEGAEEHYETLTNVMNDIPKHHMRIECGDFNAHLGRDSVRHTFHDQTNSNGNLMLEHAAECDLHITNTMFEKKKGKLWTFISDMNDSRSQIDYILINKKWKNSVHNVEAYNSFSSMGSDHRLETAKKLLSLRKSKSPAKKKSYD